MSLKTTVEIPFNGQKTRCTFEVPLDAIGATDDGAHFSNTDDIIAHFTSKLTAAIMGVVDKQASNSVAPAIDLTNPRDDAITIYFRAAVDGKRTPCTMKLDCTMARATHAYRTRIMHTISARNFSFSYDGRTTGVHDTPEKVSYSLLVRVLASINDQ